MLPAVILTVTENGGQFMTREATMLKTLSKVHPDDLRSFAPFKQ